MWAALNDPEILRQCIPGCTSFERQSEVDFTALVQAKIGPVKAGFKTKLEISQLNPPHSYTISGGGQGGAAGFGKGSADVTLTPDGGETHPALPGRVADRRQARPDRIATGGGRNTQNRG